MLVLLLLLQLHSLNLWLPRYLWPNNLYGDLINDQKTIFKVIWSMINHGFGSNFTPQAAPSAGPMVYEWYDTPSKYRWPGHLKIGNKLIFSNSFIAIFGRKGLMDEAELDCINMGGADVKWQWYVAIKNFLDISDLGTVIINMHPFSGIITYKLSHK